MEKANSSGIIRGPFLGFVMAFADVFRRERPSSSWSSCISLAKNFCRMLSSAPSSLGFDQGVVKDNLALLCWALQMRRRLLLPLVLSPLSPFPRVSGHHSPSPLFPGHQQHAASLALHQSKVSKILTWYWGKKVSGQIASSLAKMTDVEDNLFLLGDPSLLSRICENPC